jgi:hypothetical protein
VGVVKKAKTLESKLYSAIRLIWSRSKERKAIINAALDANKEFLCPACDKRWGAWAADVDHEPPIGGLQDWQETVSFIRKLFHGPQRPMCRPCHKKKTAAQRKKK